MDERIGTAEVNITPPTGLPMDGYLARQHPSQDVRDPLMAQVLILEQNDRRLVLVTLDTLALSVTFTLQIQTAIAREVMTAPECVMLCASHTHGGPAGLQDWFPIIDHPQIDSTLAESILKRLLQAVEIAYDNMIPVRLAYAAAPIGGIGMDRNQPRPAPDSQVTVLRFDRTDGTPAAIIFHYACHPTVPGPQLLYTADFPGAARKAIRRTYPDAVCLYLNGAAGNISTRFTRREQTFEEADRLGSLLGDHVIGLMGRCEPGAWELTTSRAEIDLPLRQFDSTVRNIEQTGNTRIDQARREGALLEGQLAQALAGRTSQKAMLHAFQIGPWWLLGIPGEPFNELAVELRAVSPWALVIGYTDDYVGYFPTQQAVDAATYEALSSPYDARAHDLIRTVLIGLLA